jgi:hypothetical protein
MARYDIAVCEVVFEDKDESGFVYKKRAARLVDVVWRNEPIQQWHEVSLLVNLTQSCQSLSEGNNVEAAEQGSESHWYSMDNEPIT